MRRTGFKYKGSWKGFRKSKSRFAYKKRLWGVFSEYIRRKYADHAGGVNCFTCGVYGMWQSMDAGHYYPRTNGLTLFFEEKNVHPQCTGCNRFRHGNLTSYAIKLREKYGEGILEELASMRNLMTKISEAEYYEKISLYQDKIKMLATVKPGG